MDASENLGGFTHCKFWTPLPPLELRGVGTPLVESFPHYCSRLAWISGVSIGNLLTGMSADTRPHKGFGGGFTSLCGPGANYLDTLAVAEALTGNKMLRYGTFWVLHRILGRTGLNRRPRHRRWCPVCIAGWDEETSSEPLIWNLSLLAACPTHGCDLLDVCAGCGTRQRIFVRYDQRSKCTQCRTSLGMGAKASARPHFMQWVDSQLCDLIELCATPGQPQVSPVVCQRFIAALSDQLYASERIPRSLAKAVLGVRQRSRRRRLSIRTLLNLAALQGVSIRHILLDPDSASTQPLLDTWHRHGYLPLPRSMRADKPQRAAASLEKVLERLTGIYLPPMGAGVLLPFVVVRQVVQEAYPDLCDRYDRLYVDQAPTQLRNKLRSAFGYAVQQIKASKRRTSRCPSHRTLTRLVHEETFAGSAWAPRVAQAAIVCNQIVTEVGKAKGETLPPLGGSLGWQQTCGAHSL